MQIYHQLYTNNIPSLQLRRLDNIPIRYNETTPLQLH